MQVIVEQSIWFRQYILISNILTEETLTDSQIVEYIMEDTTCQNQIVEDEDSEEDVPLTTVSEAFQGLKVFVKFFEEQDDKNDFKLKDLGVLCNYYRIMEHKCMTSKKQKDLHYFW